jgi:hypothetical protein
MSPLRTMVVDFTDPYMETNLAILLHKNSTIRNADQLVASNYSYGTLDIGWNKAVMMSSVRAPYNVMWARMASSEPSWFVHDNEEGVMRVLTEEFGFILRKPMAEYFTKKDCRLYFVEMALGNEGYGFALPKQAQHPNQSKLLAEFNAIFRNLKREGKLDEIRRKWWYDRPCPYPGYANTAATARGISRASILGLVLYIALLL